MRRINERCLSEYEAHLINEERSSGTIEKYLRDVRRFYLWLQAQTGTEGQADDVDGPFVTKEMAAAWKQSLLEKGYQPVTVNSMLAALNGFFRLMGWEDFCLRFLRIQRRSFRNADRSLSKSEYTRLLDAAKRCDKQRLALLMETICATGIRVSEVKYVTVAAASAGRAEIRLKGKIRTILLPGKLCRKLLKYARAQNISAGEIFLSATGKRLSRRQIWADMKGICQEAGVEASKVFPHNLRHLFTETFYRVSRDISRLAYLLGHSSIYTTSIYLSRTVTHHARALEQLCLIT